MNKTENLDAKSFGDSIARFTQESRRLQFNLQNGGGTKLKRFIDAVNKKKGGGGRTPTKISEN